MIYDSKSAKRKRIGISFALCVLFLGFSASANSFSPGDVGVEKYAREIEHRIKNNWYASGPLKKEVLVSFDVVDDGVIYNPRLTEQSGNAQSDGECMAAVCLSSPLAPLPIQIQTGRSLRLEVLFKATEVPARVVTELKDTDSTADYFVAFKCPPIVLTRYPELLSEKEIFNKSNFQKTNVAELVYKSHLWSNFFRTHPKATKEEVLNAP